MCTANLKSNHQGPHRASHCHWLRVSLRIWKQFIHCEAELPSKPTWFKIRSDGRIQIASPHENALLKASCLACLQVIPLTNSATWRHYNINLFPSFVSMKEEKKIQFSVCLHGRDVIRFRGSAGKDFMCLHLPNASEAFFFSFFNLLNTCESSHPRMWTR